MTHLSLTKEAADAIASTPRRRREARRELVGRRLRTGGLTEKQEHRWLDLGRRQARRAAREKAEAAKTAREGVAVPDLDIVKRTGFLGRFDAAVRPHRHRAR